MADPKYAVVKWKDWCVIYDAAVAEVPLPMEKLSSHAPLISDAEVIRHQDIAAAPIYSAYAHMIISFADLLHLDSSTRSAELTAIADHFHHAALLAEEHPFKRLPD